MKIISIFNQKGGVGKTTFALNFATYAAIKKHKKILFIDNDSQCNSSMILANGDLDNLLKSSQAHTVEDLFLTQTKIDKFILKSKFENIDFISSSSQHSQTDWEYPYKRSQSILKKFYSLEDNYDYIVIDNPPTLFKNVLELLRESDCVLSPVEPCFFSITGLFELLTVIADLNSQKDSKTRFLCFLTKVDNRKAKKNLELTKELIDTLGNSFINNSKLSFLSAYQNTICDLETLITKPESLVAYAELETLCEDILGRIK